jgi:hypothetical protein
MIRPFRTRQTIMPGDPAECRERALECIERARTAHSPQAKQLFTNLAQAWIDFALQLEHQMGLMDETAAILERRKKDFN